jgi:hypothetical protein
MLAKLCTDTHKICVQVAGGMDGQIKMVELKGDQGRIWEKPCG